jgi:hypothetical protein
MSIEGRTTAPASHFEGPESAYDFDPTVDTVLGTTDYAPTNAAGVAVICRGISFTGAGTIKVDTLGGARSLASGALLTGLIHGLTFTKIYKTGTTATGIVAYT